MKNRPCLAALILAASPAALAQPVVTNFTTSVYAVVPDPTILSFASDGTLYAGRDRSGSGGGSGDAVKVHRIAPGGSPVTEFGDEAVSDPDALIVDRLGAVSGTPGAVIVGGVHNNGSTGKLVKITPDGAVTTLLGPNALLANPSGFAFDSAGRLLITEYNGGKVLVTSGAEPTVLFSLTQAHHIVVDALGRILVTAANSTALRLYSDNGEPLNASFATVKASSPLALGPGGVWGTNVYAVAAGGTLIRVNPAGEVTPIGRGFADTSDLGFGPDGALYASEFSADRIYRIARPEVPGAETTIYARVTDPVRLAFAPDGTLFAGRDHSGSGGDFDDAVKIHRIANGGASVAEYGLAPITDPDAVVYDATGSASGIPGAVIVAGHELNSLAGKVVAIRPDQSLTTLFGPTTYTFNPNVFAYDLNGRLLISDDEGGKLWTMTNGAPTVLLTLSGALHFTADRLNRLVVGQSDVRKLRLYDASGTLLSDAFAEVAPNSPLARGSGSFWGTAVYGVDTNGDLIALDTEGNLSRVGTGFGLPYGLAFGPDGALYVSEFNSDLIWRIASANPVRLQITWVAGQAQLDVFGAVGVPTWVEWTENIAAPTWTAWPSFVLPASPSRLTDLTSGAVGTRFYRAAQQP